MANKFYAVRKGKTPGIYSSWEQCKAQTAGFSGAEYKSFKTAKEAAEFMGSLEAQMREMEKGDAVPAVEIYVDGSYNKVTKEFSYGMIILKDGQELKFAKKFSDKELAMMHNVAGEIKGAEAAMEYALGHSFESIVIYHDYEGIAKWCLGDWKTNKDGTKAYKAYYDSVKGKLRIRFVKVAGHSNDKYNDIADELAKQALGLIEEKHVICD